MRNLELTVYPKDKFGSYWVPLSVWSPFPGDDPDGFYEVTVSADDLQGRIERKRFSLAELAAEYWHARDDADCRRHRVDMGGENRGGLSADEAEDFERVMHRFATLPYHDEVQA